MSRRSSLGARLAAAEKAIDGRQSRDRYAFTLDDGRTVRLSVDLVLDVFLARDLPPVVRKVTATTETAELARSLVGIARTAREEP